MKITVHQAILGVRYPTLFEPFICQGFHYPVYISHPLGFVKDKTENIETPWSYAVEQASLTSALMMVLAC